MMRASFENMQCGDVVSKRAGGRLNRGARADRLNDQSENRDALRASARRLLLRERGAPQNAVRKMKVAETIDKEFLQAERLQDFFAFHVRRPIREVMEVSGHHWRVPHSIFAGWFGMEVASATKQLRVGSHARDGPYARRVDTGSRKTGKGRVKNAIDGLGRGA